MELTLTKLIHQEPEKRNPHKTFLSALSIASPPQRTLLSLSVPSSRPAQQILRLLDLRHASSAPTTDLPAGLQGPECSFASHPAHRHF